MEKNELKDMNKKEGEPRIQSLLIELERRVRYVRSARIEASKRLKKDHQFYQRFTNTLTFIVVFLSIWYTFQPSHSGLNNKYQGISVLLLDFSVLVTLLTMYYGMKNPADRINRFQINYMELTRLLSEIQLELDFVRSEEQLKVNYKSFAERYSSLLAQSENHDDLDYWIASLQQINKDFNYKENLEKNLEKEQQLKRKIRKCKIASFFKRIFICLSPLLILALVILIQILYLR